MQSQSGGVKVGIHQILSDFRVIYNLCHWYKLISAYMQKSAYTSDINSLYVTAYTEFL